MVQKDAGTVLVVDDEPVVLRLMTRILHRAGYQVVPARDGSEAPALAKAAHGGVDVAILDVTVPPGGAVATMQVLRREHPGLGMVLTSGDALSPAQRTFLEQCGGRFVPKPFSPADLLGAVEAVNSR